MRTAEVFGARTSKGKENLHYQPCLDWWTALVVLLHLLSISRLVVELSSQRPKPSCPRVVLCVKVLVPCWMPLHSRCLHACLCMHGATS